MRRPTQRRNAHESRRLSRIRPPDVVVQTEEVEKPVPKENEVLIEVRGASVNPLDGALLKGRPYIARIMTGLPKPRITGLGVDVAGQVEAGPTLLSPRLPKANHGHQDT